MHMMRIGWCCRIYIFTRSSSRTSRNNIFHSGQRHKHKTNLFAVLIDTEMIIYSVGQFFPRLRLSAEVESSRTRHASNVPADNNNATTEHVWSNSKFNRTYPFNAIKTRDTFILLSMSLDEGSGMLQTDVVYVQLTDLDMSRTQGNWKPAGCSWAFGIRWEISLSSQMLLVI